MLVKDPVFKTATGLQGIDSDNQGQSPGNYGLSRTKSMKSLIVTEGPKPVFLLKDELDQRVSIMHCKGSKNSLTCATQQVRNYLIQDALKLTKLTLSYIRLKEAKEANEDDGDLWGVIVSHRDWPLCPIRACVKECYTDVVEESVRDFTMFVFEQKRHDLGE